MDLFWVLVILAVWMLFSLVGSVFQRLKEQLSGSGQRRQAAPARKSEVQRETVEDTSPPPPSADDVLKEARRDLREDVGAESVSTTRSLESEAVLLEEEPRRKQGGRHPLGRLLVDKGHLDRDEVVFGVVMSEILRRPKCFRRRW